MDVIRYTFDSKLAFHEIKASLALAIVAAESLHGASQVRLNAGHTTDNRTREVVIDDTTQVGQDLNRLFVGFISREFGANAFQVTRLNKDKVSVGRMYDPSDS